MRWVKGISLVVLGAIALLTLIIGVAAPLYEANFNERRERFLQEGKPVTETVIACVIGRKGKFLVTAPQGTPLPAPGAHPEGNWIRVSPATYEQYHVGDKIDLLVIGEEFFVRDSQFYTVLTPTQATTFFGITGVLFVLLLRWKP
jgi:hypothetical protein